MIAINATITVRGRPRAARTRRMSNDHLNY
jgi:hypothetical protein